MRRLVLLAVTVLTVAGCGHTAPPGGPPSTNGSPTGAATPHPTATTTTAPAPPPATGSATASVWQLRYVLLGHYPDFAYCDPDYYPVARGDEQSAADAWWAGVNHTSPEVRTIIARHGFSEPLTGDQRLVAYRDHKKLSVITMTTVSGGYEYELSTGMPGGRPDHTVTGVVTLDGTVHERSRRPRPGSCPI
jgi:hypothetical protein